MSAFWERHKATENHARIFEDLVFCFWSPEKRVELTPCAEKFANDFEKKFLTDIGWRWVNGEQAPINWSRKQIGLIHRISDKVKQMNHKAKKKGA